MKENPTVRGELRRESVAEVFRRLGAEGLSGTVTFTWDRVRKEIVLRSGSIAWARTNREEERLGQFLLSKGVISYRHLKAVLSRLQEGRIGDLLVEAGAIRPETLAAYLQGQALEIALDLFEWNEGEYLLVPECTIQHPHAYPPIPWRHLLAQGVRRIRYWSRLGQAVDSLTGVPFRSVPGHRAEGVSLDPIDRKVLRLFEKERTLEELAGSVGVPDFYLYRSFWMLCLLGALEPVPGLLDTHAAEPGPPAPGRAPSVFAAASALEPMAGPHRAAGWFFPDLLRTIHGETRSGRLEVEAGRQKYWFFFSRGDVAAAGVDGGPGAEDDRDARSPGRIKEIAARITSAPEGRAWFSAVGPGAPPCPAARVETRALLFECLDWVKDGTILVDLLRAHFGALPVLRATAEPPDAFPLGSKEGFILSLADGKTALEEVFLLSNLSEIETAKILYQCMVLGLIEVGPSGAPEAPAGPKRPDGAAAAARPDGPSDLAVAAFAASLDRLDDFAVLGVRPGATPEEIRRAYLARIKEYHPDRARSVEARLACERIIRRVLEAGRTCFGASGAGHEAVPEGPQARGTAQGPASALASPEGRRRLAEGAFRDGERFRSGGDFYNAIQCFRIAVEHCPRELGYRLALGETLATNPKWRGEAEEQLKAAVGINPKSPVAYLALAKVHRKEGRNSTALEVLRKALFYDPGSAEIKHEIEAIQKGLDPEGRSQGLGV